MSRIVVTGSSGLIGTPLVAGAAPARATRVVGRSGVNLGGGRRGAVGPHQPHPRPAHARRRRRRRAPGRCRGRRQALDARRTSTRSSPRGSTARTPWRTAVAAPPTTPCGSCPVRPWATTATEATRSCTEGSTPWRRLLSDCGDRPVGGRRPARVDAGPSVVLAAHRDRDGTRGRRDEADAATGAVRRRWPAGLGRQFMPWITLPDQVGAYPCTCSTTPTHRPGQPHRLSRPARRTRKRPWAGSAPTRRASGAVVRHARGVRIRLGGPRRPAHRG